MSQIASGVLKHSRIRPAEPKPIGGAPPGGRAKPQAAARIVQQDAGQAVVEITCACGSVIRLRCAWDGGQDAGPATP